MFSIKHLVSLEQDWGIGILIALVLTALLLFVIYYSNNQQRFTPLSYIIALPVLALLSYQMSLLVGAVSFMNASYDISSFVSLFSVDISGMIDSEIQSSFGWYIFRRVLWSIVFLSIGGVGLYFTMEKPRSRRHGVPSGIQTGRRYNSNVSRRRR